MADLPLDPSSCLPDDGAAGTLIGRCWLPGERAGPAVVAVRPEGVFDLSQRFATVSDLLDDAAPARAVQRHPRATASARWRHPAQHRHAGSAMRRAHLLAPIDLQVIKAAGVTFATSLLERVIEEQAKGDPSRADSVRAEVQQAIGTNLATVKPGSPRGGGAESGAAIARPVEPVPRGGHRAGRRGLHQGAAAVGARHRRGDRRARRLGLEQPRARGRAGGEQPRARSSAPRSATTSTCATSKAAARCCWARARTTTARPRSARSSACSTPPSRSTTCAAPTSRSR